MTRLLQAKTERTITAVDTCGMPWFIGWAICFFGPIHGSIIYVLMEVKWTGLAGLSSVRMDDRDFPNGRNDFGERTDGDGAANPSQYDGFVLGENVRFEQLNSLRKWVRFKGGFRI